MKNRINCDTFALLFLLALSIFLFSACTEEFSEQTGQQQATESKTAIQATASTIYEKAEDLINAEGTTVEERIKVPEGFERVEAQENSFARYLRTMPLKPHGSGVKLYSGESLNTGFHAAILDVDTGDRDLQQCADSVMRLWSEYLYGIKAFDRIHFNFTNGFKADFTTWMAGKSIKVEGNEARWVENPASTGEYPSFRKYLNMVFAYAGTLSLSKEMKQVSLEDMQPGDVFIEGGSPGHAVIVLDMARNGKTGEKIFIIAQGYMPAQDMHILVNPEEDGLSPWYSCEIGEELVTPQWKFNKNLLKRFAQ